MAEVNNGANIKFIEANKATAEAHCTELGQQLAKEILPLLALFNRPMWNEFYGIQSYLIDNFNYDNYNIPREILIPYFKSMTAYLDTYLDGDREDFSLARLCKRLCIEGYIGLLHNIIRNLNIFLSGKRHRSKNGNNGNNGIRPSKKMKLVFEGEGGSKKHKKRKQRKSRTTKKRN